MLNITRAGFLPGHCKGSPFRGDSEAGRVPPW